jgi:butyryl-CoA dehydrogenase
MLLAQKAYVEGALALCLYCSSLVDESHTTQDEKTRREAELLLDVLTPVAKAWPSQYCLEANSLAIQVHGGYGYTREYPVEQFYRDNRLNPIHEGTNGIQALDLLGRKAGMNDGAAIQLLSSEISAVVREASSCDSEELQRCATLLNNALDRVMKVTRNLLCVTGRGEVNLGLANASVYLDLVGHTVVGWIWLKQAMVAVNAAVSRSRSRAAVKREGAASGVVFSVTAGFSALSALGGIRLLCFRVCSGLGNRGGWWLSQYSGESGAS